MTFQQLVQMVIEYAQQYNCSIEDAIDDVEFDGPNGGSGLSDDDTEALYTHFDLEYTPYYADEY